jgi:hypothetical protein
MFRLRLASLFVTAAFSAAPACAGDSVQELLRLSLACPAEAYFVNEGQNYDEKQLVRYNWEGDAVRFNVHVKERNLIYKVRGPEENDKDYYMAARFSDLASVSIKDNVDVVLRCKGDRSCFDDSDDPHKDFNINMFRLRACSAAAVDDIRAAIQNLMQTR